MAIRTTRSPGDGDACILGHSGCRGLTDRWWGNGCISVCSNCSVKPEVTDALMRAVCDGKWGPIPKENTDMPTPRGPKHNRFLVKLQNRRPNPAGPHANGKNVCDVICPACLTTRTLTFGGWTAIICTNPNCESELYRSKTAPELQENLPWEV